MGRIVVPLLEYECMSMSMSDECMLILAIIRGH